MKALYFGSFNPIHYGHIKQITRLLVDNYEVELMISPHNPHKDINSLLPYDLRLSICEAAINDVYGDLIPSKYTNIKINTIEETMDKPNYTYLTLRKLTEMYGYKPAIVMGTDVINNLDTWRNSEEIMTYPIIQLHRPGYTLDESIYEKIKIILVLNINVKMSSSEVRLAMENGDIDFVKKNMTKSSFKIYNRHCNINKVIKNG
tara:strand:- start:9366 stop:9977 length:612 start_codon:yes stop_codon:yes gene_type:complete